MSEVCEFPIYNESESIGDYIKRLDTYQIKLNRPIYNLVLSILNELCETKHKRLTDFRSIPKNIFNNANHIIKNKEDELKIYFDLIEFDNLDANIIIKIIDTLLKKINYVLKNNKTKYFIQFKK